MPPAGPQAQGWTGKSKAATVSFRLRWGSILSPSARQGQARYPEGGRRREDEPRETSGASARWLRLVHPRFPANMSKSGLGSRPVPTYAGEHDVKAIRGGLRAGPPGHARVRALRAHDRGSLPICRKAKLTHVT
jgi:hypothetical protein